LHLLLYVYFFFLFFNTAPTTYIYTLSLHDALPIYRVVSELSDELYAAINDINLEHYYTGSLLIQEDVVLTAEEGVKKTELITVVDRKSTRLNSSHVKISYAVFCLKKKRV